jgi:hypothetical protein
MRNLDCVCLSNASDDRPRDIAFGYFAEENKPFGSALAFNMTHYKNFSIAIEEWPNVPSCRRNIRTKLEFI